MTPKLGSIVADRFELVRELGRGAMGTVWLAEHLTLGVRCAVKFMSNEAMGDATNAASYLARFELEARAIAQLGSTNVVRIIDYATHEGVPFIAMECLQGEDLAARLARTGRLDAASTYRILSQVAKGLAKAHAAGIVHRDLKPENIFLAQDENGEVAKLLDFGVAKLTGLAAAEAPTRGTQAGTLIGTPFYMSPEQARGVEELDHRTDLWSLAVIAFECLTGRLPFHSAALGDLFAKIIFEPLPVPSEIDAICTPAFDRWWARAAAREAQDRFGGAREMIDALGQALWVTDAVRTSQGLAPAFALTVASLPSAYVEEARPSRIRTRRRSRFLVAAVVAALAPLAVTLCSGAIDARSARATARLVAPAAPPAATIAPPAAHGEPVAVSESTAPLSAPALSATAGGLAAATREPERAALRSPTRTPRRAPSVTSSSPDDIDFGI
jgi:eukaryotic-like serine/threonine-protein kinase